MKLKANAYSPAMTITLTPDQEKLVAERLGQGSYRSPEQVAAAAFSALEAEEARERKLAELRREIDVGLEELDRGERLDGATVMRELIEKNARRLNPTA